MATTTIPIQRTPLWLDSAPATDFSSLEGDTNADVVIVGAGITGLTAAKILRDAGKSVLVLDMRRVGGGETGRTTAHLTEYVDGGYAAIFGKFGAENATLVRAASRFAIDFIEQFAKTERDGCDFSRVPGFLYAENAEQVSKLEEELHHAQAVGMTARWLESAPLPFPTTGAIRMEDQAQFHPLKYLFWLAKDVHAQNGRIAEGVRVTRVEDGEPCKVFTTKGTITCRDVIVAANVPISNRVAIHTKIAPYRSYAIAARATQPIAAGLYWDLCDPYHYIRTVTTHAGDFVIVGGEDHKVGQERDTRASFDRLEAYTQQRLGVESVAYAWSGQIIEPADRLPFIGRNTGNIHVYVATGFSGNGMTFGTVAARLIGDAILEQSNPSSALFAATRVKPLAQVKRYLSENVDFPTHLIGDALSPGDVDDVAQIPRGEGRLMRGTEGMLAIYKDDEGAVHAMSAVCTHLKCRVGWNSAEKTWDCPCHGGRFDPYGEVLNGPPVEPLRKVERMETEASAQKTS